ncbi:hypothetical protein DVH24_021432 [Malus domestica]|uniref:Uncharacterized protein n=1 Tax=Malus domestica TaxID=3750 RepID=A0A498JW63_MALDO|nr:hypothetical protein DVH24_021432 [Malus domestica]
MLWKSWRKILAKTKNLTNYNFDNINESIDNYLDKLFTSGTSSGRATSTNIMSCLMIQRGGLPAGVGGSAGLVGVALQPFSRARLCGTFFYMEL